MGDQNKACFFIAPIGDEGSQERKRSNQVLKHIIEPVLSLLGYKTTRGDQITKPGLITSQIIQDVLNSELVIADLTGRNPNVFYELALRHAVRKPIIQMIEEGAKIPFDVSGMRTIPLNYQDLDSVARCKAQLAEHVRAIEENPTAVESPVTIATDIERFRSSGEPIENYLAEARAFQAEIGQRIYNLEGAMARLLSAQPPRLEYRTLSDGSVGNVLVMPPAYVPSTPPVSFIDPHTSAAINASQLGNELSPELVKAALSAIKKHSIDAEENNKNEK